MYICINFVGQKRQDFRTKKKVLWKQLKVGWTL